MTIFQEIHNDILVLRSRMRHAESCLSYAKERLRSGWDPYETHYGSSEEYDRYCHEEIKEYKWLVNVYRKELEEKNKEYKRLIRERQNEQI